MDWYDQSGEIYLHAILTVVINFRLGSNSLVASLNYDFVLVHPILVASAKMYECKLAAFSLFVLLSSSSHSVLSAWYSTGPLLTLNASKLRCQGPTYRIIYL